MFIFGVLVLILAVGAFGAIGVARPKSEAGAATRILGLGASGLLVIWAVVSEVLAARGM